ncbi:acetylglutamate kinase [Balneola sp. MJW-20]|uniref:acetylglutamate kinase n=1 Tax=Gracilimonas aurantiaca TaxID=3234185 RepID=UPI0034651AE6
MKKVKVIKIGGKIIDDARKMNKFLDQFARLEGPKILIHGGGNMASRIGKEMGIIPNMIDGRRVTDKETLEVVSMVYGGLVNKRLVAALQKKGVNAMGLTGADADIIRSKKRSKKPVDFGFVGDITSVNTKRLKSIMKSGIVPVIAPLTHDGKGQMLNTNADTIAAHIAIAFGETGSTSLQYYFDMKGVMNGKSVMEILSTDDYHALKANGKVSDGMIPKLDTAFHALTSGVKSVRIAGHQYLNQVEGGTYLLL